MENLTEAKVFVCGEQCAAINMREGFWQSLVLCKNMAEFKEACADKLPIRGVGRHVYFDYENIPSCYITLKWLSPELFPLIRSVSELKVAEQCAFTRWLGRLAPDLSGSGAETLINAFRYCYEGVFRNELQFGLRQAEEKMGITPHNSPGFDFAGYTGNLFHSSYFMEGRFVFKKISVG